METGRKIKNREELLSHGDRESRKIVLDIAEGTLPFADFQHGADQDADHVV